MVMEGANPELHLGYSGSGATPTSDIAGSSKIFLNRADDAAHLTTMVFEKAGTGLFTLGEHDDTFRIATGGNLKTDANAAISVDSSKFVFIQTIYDETTSGSANVLVGSTGRCLRITSSSRYKEDVNYDGVSGSLLYELKPCSFKSKSEYDKGKEYIGFIAEDVDKVEKRLVSYNDNEEPESLHYSNFTALIVKAIQELSAKLDTMQTEINTLKEG